MGFGSLTSTLSKAFKKKEPTQDELWRKEEEQKLKEAEHKERMQMAEEMAKAKVRKELALARQGKEQPKPVRKGFGATVGGALARIGTPEDVLGIPRSQPPPRARGKKPQKRKRSSDEESMSAAEQILGMKLRG